MKTSILVPITIVVIALGALGVAVWQVVAPSPITATNSVTQTVSVQTPDFSGAPTATPKSLVPIVESEATPTQAEADQSPGKGDAASATTTTTTVYIAKECKIGGCSAVVCEDFSAEPAMTTCEYKTEYACYHEAGARCEVQANGHCGWTQTPELKKCVNEKKTPAAQ